MMDQAHEIHPRDTRPHSRFPLPPKVTIGRNLPCGALDSQSRQLLQNGTRTLIDEGDLRESRKWFDRAYYLAEVECDSAAMAHAALGFAGLWVHEHRGVVTSTLTESRLREAAALVDPESTLGLRLRVRLAAEADYRSGHHADALALLAEARQCGDPIALVEALNHAHHCLMGPEHGAVRTQLVREMISAGFRTGRPSDMMMGLLWQSIDLLLAGDRHAQRSLRELRELLASKDNLAIGFVVSAIDVMLTIRSGELDKAEALASDGEERGRAAGDSDAIGWHAAHLSAIRWYQGRIGEMVPYLRELVASPTLSAVDNSLLASLAVAAAHAGDSRTAAGALARLRGHGFDELPRSGSWLVTMYGVTEAAFRLNDVEAAESTYTLLTPFERLPMIASLGVACFGSAQQALGLGSLTAGDAEQAVEHLRTAVQDNLALEHWPAAALSRSRLALALRLRSAPGDQREAEREEKRAKAEAAGLGMRLPDPPDFRSISRPGNAGQPKTLRLSRSGRQWLIEYGRHSAHLDDSLGLGYLSVLIANPRQEIPAIELASGLKLTAAAHQTARLGQTMLDGEAVKAYRHRLALLQEEIDEYAAANDSVRAATARAERDWLIDELSAATGLGGNARHFADDAERARISVGKAIRRAIGRVGDASPRIGAELRTTIRTGLRCCYQPR